MYDLNHVRLSAIHEGDDHWSPRGEQQQVLIEPVIVMGWIHISGVEDVSKVVEGNIRFQEDAIEGEALGVKSIGHGVSLTSLDWSRKFIKLQTNALGEQKVSSAREREVSYFSFQQPKVFVFRCVGCTSVVRVCVGGWYCFYCGTGFDILHRVFAGVVCSLFGTKRVHHLGWWCHSMTFGSFGCLRVWLA